jgi:Zn-dependent protease with chaperone function
LVTFRGDYYDGRSARKHSVRVQFEADTLRLVSDDKTINVAWPFEELRSSERPRPGQPVRLSLALNADARLIVPDVAFVELLRQSVPRLFARGLARPENRKWTAVILLALLGIGLFGWKGIPALADTIAPLVPQEWARDLGRGLRDLILTEERHCRDPDGQAALEQMVTRLTGGRWPEGLKVTVANIDVPNAFALPGGQIIILRGLLNGAGGPDEVAGVLAHELGHVVDRHPLRGFLRAAGFELLLSFVVGDVPILIELAVEGGGLVLALSYSRDMELQADKFAVDMLTRSGVGSAGLQAFFERIAKLEEEMSEQTMGTTAYFSTHPDTRGRIEVIAQAPAQGSSPALDDAGWAALKDICKSLDKKPSGAD